ncbi:hypothetical protein [Luteimonas aquatica]|uniref:hypothetical protein n=1 Tax=Luteimonas aquatica TaxID=450364 RepID=UPI001F59A560|nr:hypothetical protein [Luteimonas aquatica]
MRRPLRLFPLLLACAALASAGAWAQDRRGGDHGRGVDRGQMMQRLSDRDRMEPQMRQPRRQDELSNAVRNAERNMPGGQVLRAERIQYDGRDVSRIKIMDERGRVRTYMDDPQQRRQSPTRGDDD